LKREKISLARRPNSKKNPDSGGDLMKRGDVSRVHRHPILSIDRGEGTRKFLAFLYKAGKKVQPDRVGLRDPSPPKRGRGKSFRRD